jgi:DNA-binding transcriptional MerR regulator
MSKVELHNVSKAPDAFRTISEVADDLDLPQHVLRFWETRFSQIRPMKRGGGRRYYRPDDINLLKGIRHLLYGEGYTIKGVQKILKENGIQSVIELGDGGNDNDALHAGKFTSAGYKQEHAAANDEPAIKGQEPYVDAHSENYDDEETMSPQVKIQSGDVKQLEKTLFELLECKRILENAVG